MTSVADVAVVGTGIVGISTAYYLAKHHGVRNIVLIDKDQPMSFTSAQSGENYRNWWPHPAMVAFTNRSIDLLETIAQDSDNQINMNRRGYSLATRSTDIEHLLQELRSGLGESAEHQLRFHKGASSSNYQAPLSPDWRGAPEGVDILSDQQLIRETFPSYAEDIRTVVHIRRGGDISGQQLGSYMLSYLKQFGASRIIASVESIEKKESFHLQLSSTAGTSTVVAKKVVNAAGPFADKIAEMLGVELPIYNSFQQKIAFEDKQKSIPRNMPFSIDLDAQYLDWSDEEREMLLQEPSYQWLAEQMPGAIHCRPDGGDNGTWLKLGWAFNEKAEPATWESPLGENFPEIVLRGAARLNPSLKAYYDKLPRSMHHYGGWYTMTEENWPLIGPMGPEGSYMNCALSGFGTMAACAAGELCAAWVSEADLPEYAVDFSLQRRDNAELMQALYSSAKGVL